MIRIQRPGERLIYSDPNIRAIAPRISGVAVFVPTDIAGLELWLDFADITTLFQDVAQTVPVTADGDLIRAVTDKSGSGNDASQAVATREPIYKTPVQNSLSICRFDGANDDLTLTGITVASGSFTFFAASNPTNNPGEREYFFDCATGRLLICNNASGSGNVGWYDGTWRTIAAATFTSQILTWVFTSGGNGEVFRNGASLGTAAYSAKAIGGTTNLGSTSGGESDSWKGDFYEFLIYSSALSSANRALVRNYLNNKWAIY